MVALFSFSSPARAFVLAAGLLAGAGGCLELETRIALHPDGSGTVRERLSFSRRLLKMAENAPDKHKLLHILTKEAARERMKRMGKGVSLVTHETRKRDDGSLESVAVFKIAYFGDLIYVSPFMNGESRIKELRANLHANLHFRHWSRRGVPPGSLVVSFSESKPQAAPAAGPKDGARPSPPRPAKPFKLPAGTPRGLQAYRALAPVFADVMQGFHLRVTFESYAPIDNYHWQAPLRNADAHPLTCDLLNFSSENLDQQGGRFIQNEEVMLALLRGYHRFSRHATDRPGYSHFLAANLRYRQNNHALPMLNATGGASFQIKPSKELFDRLFKGKKLHWTYKDKKYTREARFKDIGWTPPK
jgi:hypothetical protein